jgi:NUDIX domain
VSKGRVGSAGRGSSSRRLREDDRRDDQRPQDEGRPSADRCGDQAPNQLPRYGADAPIDEGETYIQTAVRRLREETGIDIGPE